MVKFDFKTKQDEVLSNSIDLKNSPEKVDTNIVTMVKMLDFHGVNKVQVVISKGILFKKTVVINLYTFQDVVEFCENNETLVVNFVTKEEKEMRIYARF